ncbi:proline-rich protein 7 isoform X2 [Columba livia]|uniref:proline-rich protein 7 isoform X2 n=1 Tax=Columba livia TaxID=8932 RepID=UPI0031B9F825
MLLVVAWATAPPPAHHVAQGPLPRLPPPAAVGKGKAAPGPRCWWGRRPGSPCSPSPWPDDARGPRHAHHLCATRAPREHPNSPAWPQTPARLGCSLGTPATIEPAPSGCHGHTVRSGHRRRVPARAPSQRWAAGPCRPHSPVAHPASPLPHHPPSAPRPDPPAPAPPAPWRGWTPDGRRPRAGGDAAGYLRRRVKRQQEERLREQSLRALELEPLHYEGYGGSPPGIAIPHRLRLEPHHHHPHHIPPPRPWSCRHESDLSKPPCYEEALLMAEPPPPYSEVLMDTRGLYRKINAPFLSHERLEKQEQPPSYKPLFLDAGYGSALHLPRSASPSPACPDLYLQAECSPRMFPSWTDSELSSRDTYEPGPWHLPVSMPLFGRTTAV